MMCLSRIIKLAAMSGYSVAVAYTTVHLASSGADPLFSLGLSIGLVPTVAVLGLVKMGETAWKAITTSRSG